MYEQENNHLEKLSEICTKLNVRPSVLMPFVVHFGTAIGIKNSKSRTYFWIVGYTSGFCLYKVN